MWQEMARTYKSSGKGGPTWTERCVGLVIMVSRWLHVDADLVDGAIMVPKRWRKKLAADWIAITKEKPRPIERPRHTVEEAQKIMGALDDPGVDPRIRLVMEVGSEARLGQTRRMLRSSLDLSATGAFGLGRLTVDGSGDKLGVERDLTPSDRSDGDHALATYLAPLEKAYRSGSIPDYALCPAGRLRYNIAPSRRRKGSPPSIHQVPPEVVRDPVRAATPVDDRTLNDWFLELERIAGVTHVPGRAWYGLRRLGSDIAEDHEADARVLNDLTGHVDSTMRQRVYQERKREKIQARVAHLRHRLRTEVLIPPAVEDGKKEEES